MTSSMSVMDLASHAYHLQHIRTLITHTIPLQAPDLISFSPAQSLINSSESPAKTHITPSKHTEKQLLHRETKSNKSTSPLVGKGSSESVLSARGLSPLVHVTPHTEKRRSNDQGQTVPPRKKVRFDIDDSIVSDAASEDPLAIDATIRKNIFSKQAQETAASNKASPLNTAKTSKPLRRKSVGVTASKPSSMKPGKPGKPGKLSTLEQFNDGGLHAESNDEKQTLSQAIGSEDTKDTIILAKRAVTAARRNSKPTNESTPGTRKSQRTPKPRDFGDVVAHGWRSSQTKKS